MDAVICWYIGFRFTGSEALFFGDEDEGVIWI
jgi:hypothetical protein